MKEIDLSQLNFELDDFELDPEGIDVVSRNRYNALKDKARQCVELLNEVAIDDTSTVPHTELQRVLSYTIVPSPSPSPSPYCCFGSLWRFLFRFCFRKSHNYDVKFDMKNVFEH